LAGQIIRFIYLAESGQGIARLNGQDDFGCLGQAWLNQRQEQSGLAGDVSLVRPSSGKHDDLAWSSPVGSLIGSPIEGLSSPGGFETVGSEADIDKVSVT
jgi:hypothetical protein